MISLIDQVRLNTKSNKEKDEKEQLNRALQRQKFNEKLLTVAKDVILNHSLNSTENYVYLDFTVGLFYTAFRDYVESYNGAHTSVGYVTESLEREGFKVIDGDKSLTLKIEW